MKFILCNSKIGASRQKSLPFKLKSKEIGELILYSENYSKVIENKKFLGITEGYLRDFDKPKETVKDQTLSAFSQFDKNWPASENVSGSFTSVIVNKLSKSILLCTDLIGLYPIYYLVENEIFYISNSIILLGRISETGIDGVGVLQRSIGEGISNIGSRTILKNCKRLLSGEQIRFDYAGAVLEKKYDNSLFQNITSSKQQHNLQRKYWEDLTKEVKFCLQEDKEVKVALSGGIDSRILLGAIPDNKNISCLTYGAADDYETKVAKKIAKIKQANFYNFQQENIYFPTKNKLKEYVLKTEAVQINSWLQILENVENQNTTPLLLGELSEALPARNIKRFSSRSFRQKNFFKYYILGKDYNFEASTPEKFNIWKDKVTKRYLIFYIERRRKRINISISQNKLETEIKKDLSEIFDRVEAHNLPYVELYDELFSWYTFVRMRMSKQLLLSNSHFKAVIPTMSLKVLRNTSNLHPNLRLNYRFAKKLFSTISILRKFNVVPTSQAPLIPQNFPDFIKFPMWGIRSKLDSFLIKRLMKSKGKYNSYRLFKSTDWAAVYQLPNMEKNLKSYFENNELGTEFTNNIIDIAKQRQSFTQWPFTNYDIINSASLNMELSLIKGNEK